MSRRRERDAMTSHPTLEFFYAGNCPWSYLAFARLREVAMRTGRSIEYRPVIPAAVDAGRPPLMVGAGTAIPPAIANYLAKDLKDWARFCGVTLGTAAAGPTGGEWVHRGAIVAIDAGCIASYVREVFEAIFGAGRDLGSREVVREIAVASGVDAHLLEAGFDSQAVREALERNTAMLRERGGFAPPTVFFGADMYVGHERMTLLESAVMRAGDRVFIAPGEHGR